MGRPAGSELLPVQGTPEDARRWYDRISGIYARFIERVEAPPVREAIEWVALQPDDVAVDLGCGAGGGVVAMAERLEESGAVIGIDFAPGMCRETADSIRTVGVEDRAAIACADVTATPLRSDSVDAALSSYVFDLLSPSDLEAALGEARRILRPGGKLATVTLAESDAFATRCYETLHRMMPRKLDCRPIPIRVFLKDAGFAIDRSVERSLYGLPVTIVIATVE